MVLDSTTIRVETLKTGARRLSMQGRSIGIAVVLSRASLKVLLEELSLGLAPTLYEILGVTPTASGDDIQTAYRRRAREHHPDVHDSGEHAAMADLNGAYEVLSDPEKRRQFDQSTL